MLRPWRLSSTHCSNRTRAQRTTSIYMDPPGGVSIRAMSGESSGGVQAYIALRRNANSTEEITSCILKGMSECTRRNFLCDQRNVTNQNGLAILSTSALSRSKKALLSWFATRQQSFRLHPGQGQKSCRERNRLRRGRKLSSLFVEWRLQTPEVRHSWQTVLRYSLKLGQGVF